MLLHQTKSDHRLYDDLTLAMKNFKKTVQILTKITHQTSAQDHNCPNIQLLTHCQNEAKQMAEFFHSLGQHYNNEQFISLSHKTHMATFSRFSCRLIETLSYSRIRSYVNTGDTPSKTFVDQTFQILSLFRTDSNLSNFFKKLSVLIRKYTRGVPYKFQEVVGRRTTHQLEFKNLNQKAMMKTGSIKTKGSHSETRLNRIMEAFNRSYNSMSLMDIDYGNYRNTFYQSRASVTKDEVIENCLYRNRLIKGQITVYSKRFQEYTTKSAKELRKRKQRLSLNCDFLHPQQSKRENKSMKVVPQKKQTVVFHKTRNGPYLKEKTQAELDINPIKSELKEAEQENSNGSIRPSEKVLKNGKEEATNLIRVVNLNNLSIEEQTRPSPTITPQRKKQTNLNPVTINGSKLNLAPIRGVSQQQVYDNICEKRRKLTFMLNKEKYYGSHKSVGKQNVVKFTTDSNIFKIKPRPPHNHEHT